MANWNGGILTNKGRALAAKVEAGTCKLALTKMKVGDGSSGSVETLTDLVSPKQIISLSAIVPSADGTCDVSGVLTNATLEKGFYLRELGLFATDPDEGEILYAVSTDTTPDYLQAKGGATSLALDVHMKIAIASASSISVEGKLEGLVTAEQLKAHNASETAHENRLKVASTSSKPASMADKGLWLETLQNNGGKLNVWDAIKKQFGVVHPETEAARITDFANGIVQKLALTSAMTAVTALQKDSWFGKLLKMALTASGVKYSIAQNGYVCLGDLFGGLIIQWGSAIIAANNLTSEAVAFPIGFSKFYKTAAIHQAIGGAEAFDACTNSLNSIYFKKISTGSGSFTISFIVVGT